jgi:type IV secretory pathway VirB10-like protein
MRPLSLLAAAPRVRARTLIAHLAAVLLTTACATSESQRDYRSSAGVAPAQVAVATPPKVEMEADGLPGQPPPRVRRRPEPDDPAEPFSPSYGSEPQYQPNATHDLEPRRVPRSEPPRRADSWQPQQRAAAAAPRRAMTPAEADAIVARAILEHERRYP